jgi:hypothetical protein
VTKGFIVVGLALAACGGEHATPDASVVLIDSPGDTAPADAAADAAPDAPPPYDFSCFGAADPTTADDEIAISGVVTVGQDPTQGVIVAVWENGIMTALDFVTTGANGEFAAGLIDTHGVPFGGYLEAEYSHFVNGDVVEERITYLYPANKLTTSVANVRVPILDAQSLQAIETISGHTQDDATNGLLIVAVTDCGATPQPLAGATLSVTQNGNAVGEVFDPSVLDPQLAGTFIVFNVPDGATDVAATYGGMTFPAHTVQVHKQNGLAIPSLTETQVRPGP